MLLLFSAIRTFYENDFESMDRLESGAEAITYKAYSANYGYFRTVSLLFLNFRQVCAKLFHSRAVVQNGTGHDNRREINFLLKVRVYTGNTTYV